jgi:hypothetical protein
MESEIVLLCSGVQPTEAPVIMSILEDAGISYMAQDSPGSPYYGKELYATPMYPVDIYVHKDELKAARKILDELKDSNLSDPQ